MGCLRQFNSVKADNRNVFGHPQSYIKRSGNSTDSQNIVPTKALAPGFFPTELTTAVFENRELAAANAVQTCIGRNGESPDIEGPLLFFCSNASSNVTGQILFVDGGFTAI